MGETRKPICGGLTQNKEQKGETKVREQKDTIKSIK